MKQVYIARQGTTYWLSTNPGILRRLVGISTLDPVGTALFLTLGWAGTDRTLDAGINVLDGGVVLRSRGVQRSRSSSLLPAKRAAKPSSRHKAIRTWFSCWVISSPP